MVLEKNVKKILIIIYEASLQDKENLTYTKEEMNELKRDYSADS